MGRYGYAVALIAALLMALAACFEPVGVAYGQSIIGQDTSCGTYTWHEDLTKGRTDGMVVHVHHTVGCWTYDFTNLIGADRQRMATNPKAETDWQDDTCYQDGVQQTVGHFKWYRGVDIDPSSVRVECSRYHGPD